MHRQLIKIKLSIVEQNGARGGSSSCPEVGASVVKSAGNPLSQRQERIVARSWRTAEMVRGPGPGNRRCVKFNYVIHCPCRLSNPRPPKDLPSTRRRFHRMIRRCVTQGCLRSSQQCDRGPWTLISLSTRSPRSLSTRIRQICPSIPLLFAHYSPSVPLELPPTTARVSFDFEGRRILARVVDSRRRQRKTGAPDSLCSSYV